ATQRPQGMIAQSRSSSWTRGGSSTSLCTITLSSAAVATCRSPKRDFSKPGGQMSRGQGRVYQRGSVWWLDYSVGGRQREPTDAATKRDAQDVLRKRIGDRQAGKLIGRPDRVLLAEYEKDMEGKEKLVGGLRWLHETQHDLDGLRSKERAQQAWNHI